MQRAGVTEEDAGIDKAAETRRRIRDIMRKAFKILSTVCSALCQNLVLRLFHLSCLHSCESTRRQARMDPHGSIYPNT